MASKEHFEWHISFKCVSEAPKRSGVYLETQFESNNNKKTTQGPSRVFKNGEWKENYVQTNSFLLKTLYPRMKGQPALLASDFHTFVSVSLKLLPTQAQSSYAKGTWIQKGISKGLGGRKRVPFFRKRGQNEESRTQNSPEIEIKYCSIEKDFNRWLPKEGRDYQVWARISIPNSS